MADDPDVAMADFFQVTPAQLRAWRAAEGRHRCPGRTTRGHGCRNRASAAVDYDPQVWAARAPSFCPTHTPSKEQLIGGGEGDVADQRPRPLEFDRGVHQSGEDDTAAARR